LRRDTLLALGVLAAAWAATLWLSPFDNETLSDLYVYRIFAARVLHGGLPYRDVFFEYPPLAAPAIALPGLFGTTADAFRAAFAGWTLLLAAACVLLTGAIAARTGGSRRTALFAVAVAPLLCGAMVRTHFDLAPVALLLAALLALCDERPRLGLALLALATLTKGFPLLAAAPALAWVAARRGPRIALGSAAVLAVVVAVVVGVTVAVSPSGALDALRYQTERPVQVESSPAIVLRALSSAGAGYATSVNGFGSDGLEHPAAGVVAAAFVALLAVALALLARAPWRRPDARTLVLASLATAAAYAVLGKVLSPQYLIWTVPLGALALAWGERLLAAATAAAIVLTQVEFPARYFDVVLRDPPALVLVGVRNAALLAALALTMRALTRLEQGAALSTWPGRRHPPRSAPRSATDPLPRSQI
jgi:uncharacterized membrane protein